MESILNSTQMDQLLTLVEEASRSAKEGVKHFVEPAPGTLRRATTKRHHIIFGRRGSGKSSLLRKAAADLTVDRRPIAYVNLEGFKGHSYPDVLLSVLIYTFQEFEGWMKTAAIHPATRTSFWQTLFGKAPKRPSYNKQEATRLAERLAREVASLSTELYRTDEADLTVTSEAEASEKDTATGEIKSGIGIKVPPVKIGSSAEAQLSTELSQKESQQVEEKYKRSKTDFLLRHILDYQKIFRELGNLSEGDGYLFLDDLYHIRRIDQPKVVDYFHRIAKDHNLWLKIGTIRHRTRWYIQGDPPLGMKIGDDADEIDLDVTLEKYSLAKEFLVKILSNYASEVEITPITIFLADGAIDRLVLASGGVARDFLSIFRRSVYVARERGGGYRGEKVGAEDVNTAAGEYDSSKREEFKKDTLDDKMTLEKEFYRLQTFCLEENNTNCFLLDKEQRGTEVDQIHELVDLKLVHLVRSRVTVSGRPGRIYEAYMLDLSQYAGARKKRKLEMIEFWKPTSKEALRKKSLIYEPKEDNQEKEAE